MIQIYEATHWSEALSSQRIELDPIDRVPLTALDLPRSISFYARVFGFRSVRARQGGTRRSVVMSTSAQTELVIHEQANPAASVPSTLQRWAFVVNDLDWARQAVWDLGIELADASKEPDQIYRWQNGRSLYICDPDSNVIELVEVARAASTPPAPVLRS